MKRNLIVVLVIVVALGLMAWSGYQNLERRRAAQKAAAAMPQMTMTPEPGGSSAAQQAAATDEDLPNLRGKVAPPFTLKTADGRKVSLSDYKGKAVLLNFWATWCVPCKLEMPWFVDLQKQYGSQGLVVLGVNEDDEKDRSGIAPFAQKIGINYPILMSDEATNKVYGGVDVLPTTFYIGRNGKIVDEAAGLISRDEIEANIKKALAAGN